MNEIENILSLEEFVSKLNFPGKLMIIKNHIHYYYRHDDGIFGDCCQHHCDKKCKRFAEFKPGESIQLDWRLKHNDKVIQAARVRYKSIEFNLSLACLWGFYLRKIVCLDKS